MIYLGARHFGRSKEYSAKWIARRIKEENKSKAVKILKIWAHLFQKDNCSTTLVQELNWLTDSDAILALKTVKIKKQQLDIKIQLTTLNTIEEFTIEEFTLTALINSGCTNLYINWTFIKEEKINIQKYKNPILSYNANSFWNQTGTITDFVKVKLNIGDHLEQIHLAVVELEKTSLFLGYDWLQKYNPVIN